jgi:hypothetical protein
MKGHPRRDSIEPTNRRTEVKLRTRLFALFQVGAGLLAVSALAGSGVAHAADFGVTISNLGTRKCLTVPNASRVSSTPIVQWICDTANVPGQHWVFQGPSNTVFRGALSLDTGLCVEASGFDNGAPVIEASCGSWHAGLFWTITDLVTPRPTSRIIRLQSSVKTSVCLDLENGDVHDGVPLQVWQCNSNTNNQKWYVTEAPN